MRIVPCTLEGKRLEKLPIVVTGVSERFMTGEKTNKNPLIAATLSAVFSVASAGTANAARTDSPDLSRVNAHTATPASEYFTSEGGKNAVDYGQSTSPADIYLGSGFGVGGDATGDAYDSGIIHVKGPNSTAYSTLEGVENSILQGTGRTRFVPSGANNVVVGGRVWNALDMKNYYGVTIDTARGEASQGLKLYGNIGNIKATTGDDTLVADGSVQLFQGLQGNDTYVYNGGKLTINEPASSGGFDAVRFSKNYGPELATISGNQIIFDPNNSVTFDDINRIERFSFHNYPDMSLAQLRSAIEATRMTVPSFASEARVCAGTSAVQNFTTVAGVTCDAVDYRTSPQAVTVTLGTDAVPGVGAGGNANGDTFGTPIRKVIGANATSYNQFFGNGNNNIFYGAGTKNLFHMNAGCITAVGSENGWNVADFTKSPQAVYANTETGVYMNGYADCKRLFHIDRIRGSQYGDTFVVGGDINVSGEGGNDVYIYKGGSVVIEDVSGSNKIIFDDQFKPENAVLAGSSVSFGTGNSVTFSNINSFGQYAFGYTSPANDLHKLQDVLTGDTQLSATARAGNYAGLSRPTEPIRVTGMDSGESNTIIISLIEPTRVDDGRESCMKPEEVVTHYVIDFRNIPGFSNFQESREISVNDPLLVCSETDGQADTHCDTVAKRCEIDLDVYIPPMN